MRPAELARSVRPTPTAWRPSPLAVHAANRRDRSRTTRIAQVVDEDLAAAARLAQGRCKLVGPGLSQMRRNALRKILDLVPAVTALERHDNVHPFATGGLDQRSEPELSE